MSHHGSSKKSDNVIYEHDKESEIPVNERGDKDS